MAISIIGTPQTANVNNGGTVTCTFSTTPSEGDYTVAIIGSPAPSAAIGTITTSGYTLLTSHTGAAAANPSLAVWYKKQGSSPDTTVAGTSGNGSQTDSSMIAFVLRGVDATTFSDATPTTAGETSSTNPDPASIAGASANFCAIVMACMTVTMDTSVTAPSGYTGYSVIGDDTYDHTLAAAYKLDCNGTEAPASWTGWSTGLWYAITIAVKPAATPLSINTGDSATEPDVTVTENIEIGLDPKLINVYDSINVSEQDPPTVLEANLIISAVDSAFVSQDTGTTNVGFGQYTGNVRYRGQGFKTSGQTITAIKFNYSPDTYDLKVYIDTADSNSYPEHAVGSEIYSWVIPYASLSAGMTKYTLPTPLATTSGQQYCFYLAPWSGGAYQDNWREIVSVNSNAYADGYATVNVDGTWSISDSGNLDLRFILYTEAGPIDKTNVSESISNSTSYNINVYDSVNISEQDPPTVEIPFEEFYSINVYDELFTSEDITSKADPLSIEIAQWYNQNWGYREKLTIDKDQVGADLTDFPIYVRLGDLSATFHTNVNQTDARDIRVTKADGITELPREVVSYNSTTDAGELYFKYTGTLSSSIDTDVYIYYGNASASNYADDATYGAYNVWNDNYVAVYHLAESSGSAKDSSGNGNTGTFVGNLPNRQTGHQAGTYSQYFDGSVDGVIVARNIGDFENNAITVAIMFKRDGTQNDWAKFIHYSYADNSPYGSWSINLTNDDVSVNAKVGSDTTNYDLSPTFTSVDATWYYASLTHNGTAQEFRVNGSQIATGSNAITLGDYGEGLGIGRCWSSTEPSYTIKGYIAEVRISKTARLSTWTDTEYRNMSAPTTFYSLSAAEVACGEPYIAISEDIQIEVGVNNLNIENIYDEIFASENIETKVPVEFINIYDEVFISENITILQANFIINVFGNIQVSEDITAIEQPIQTLSVFDEVFVSEDINAIEQPIQEINIFDEICISENIEAIEQPIQTLNVYDNVNTSEDITIGLDPKLIDIGDDITVSENVQATTSQDVYFIDIGDDINISENISTLEANLVIAPIDAVFVSQDTGSTNVGWGEWANIRYRGQGFKTSGETITAIEFYYDEYIYGLKVYIDTADSNSYPEHAIGSELYSWEITYNELTTSNKFTLPIPLATSSGQQYVMYFAPWNTSTHAYVDNFREMVYVNSNVYADGYAVLYSSGAWSISDSGNLDLKFKLYTASGALDKVNITEDINAQLLTGAYAANVYDEIYVSESIVLYLSLFNLNVLDNIEVSESVTTRVPSLFINVFDNTTISEDIQKEITTGIATINVYDSINISEDISLSIPSVNLEINVYDSIEVSDGIYSLYDEIAVSEDINESYPWGEINVSENIAISEGLTIRSPLQSFSTGDDTTVTDNVSILRTFGEASYDISVYDDVNLSESLTPTTNFYNIIITDSITITDIIVYGLFLFGWYYESEPYQGWSDVAEAGTIWTDTTEAPTSWN